MMLETLINGASGCSFFKHNDFDTVLDSYYHTRAISLVAPYYQFMLVYAKREYARHAI